MSKRAHCASEDTAILQIWGRPWWWGGRGVVGVWYGKMTRLDLTPVLRRNTTLLYIDGVAFCYLRYGALCVC